MVFCCSFCHWCKKVKSFARTFDRGRQGSICFKKPAPEARVWSCHLFASFCHRTLYKSNLIASPVEFGSGRRRKGQPVPEVARDGWCSATIGGGFSRAVLRVVVLVWGKEKPLGGEEGTAQPSQLVHVLMLCGQEREIAVLRHKMKMAVKYLLEAIRA